MYYSIYKRIKCFFRYIGNQNQYIKWLEIPLHGGDSSQCRVRWKECRRGRWGRRKKDTRGNEAPPEVENSPTWGYRYLPLTSHSLLGLVVPIYLIITLNKNVKSLFHECSSTHIYTLLEFEISIFLHFEFLNFHFGNLRWALMCNKVYTLWNWLN